MQISKLIRAVIIGSTLFMGATTANAQGCSLDGVVLKCNSEAKTAKAILKAFASQETRQLLGSPLSELDRFSQNGDLEKYRRSMELNWRVITRFARKQERRRDRRRLSESAYLEWAENFAEAQKSYKVALNFYRQLHWQGKK